jgi:hypothetical protein
MGCSAIGWMDGCFEFGAYLELHICGALVNYRNLWQIYVTQQSNVTIMNCDLCC